MIVQIVIYDLPNRDCAAKASNGEFTIANNGVANYEGYINQISAAVSAYPNVRVVAVVEPDSLANLVTNLSVAACSAAQSAYLTCTTYVLKTLTQCNVWLYLDAGHAGWLGWPANIGPAATLFTQVYKSSVPNRVRGLATNVANYNALQATTPDPITQGDPNYDEYLYITALGPMLAQDGFPASFVTDMGRSGVQDLRVAWGDWCNIKGAGMGLRPTASGLPTTYLDAIVWVKVSTEASANALIGSCTDDCFTFSLEESVTVRRTRALLGTTQPARFRTLCNLHLKLALGSKVNNLVNSPDVREQY